MIPVTISRQRAGQLDHRAAAEYGVPGIVLMENAGRGVADKLVELGVRGTVVICCGSGNNGGDGFVIARHLDLRRIGVKVLTWGNGDRRPADAATNFGVLLRSGIAILRADGLADVAHEFSGAAWIVDGAAGHRRFAVRSGRR